MADFTLTAAPILGGYNQTIAGCTLTERTDLAMVSLAIPQKGKAKLTKALKEGFGLSMPTPVKSTSKDGVRLLQTSADQLMLIFPHDRPDAVAHVREKIGETAYLTDQTDVWVILELDGEMSRDALERLSPIDLSADQFVEGANARTVMEHMGALVMRTGKDKFMLASASSSAKSFLHAVETSLHYID